MSRPMRKLSGLSLFLTPVLAALLSAPPAAAQIACTPYTFAPYDFILLDTSGSLNYAPSCTQAELDAGDCSQLCAGPDCYTPLQADSPSSKLFQIKQSLHEALQSTEAENISFGFASFNQDTLRAESKHWLYAATANGVSIPGWGPFPAAGWQEVVGRTFNCSGSGNDAIGCSATTPADLTDAWELNRVRELSKGGASFNQTVVFYIRHAGMIHRMQYTPVLGGTLGSAVSFQVRSERCLNSSCSSRAAPVQSTVPYAPLAEFLGWQNLTSRTEPFGYFNSANDTYATNTCSGWDPNTDTTSDRFNGYSLRWPTAVDPRGSLLDRGDMIPFDWQNDHRQHIRERLAPNLAIDPLAAPDFRISPYLRDSLFGSETFLRLKDERSRPLIAVGTTPLGGTLRSFHTWYAGCAAGICSPGAGWHSLALAQDPLFTCRPRSVILITDGDETCASDACDVAADLYDNYGVRTYVVGYGTGPLLAPTLPCIAANGGTVDPLYPRNPTELRQALEFIFDASRQP